MQPIIFKIQTYILDDIQQFAKKIIMVSTRNLNKQAFLYTIMQKHKNTK